MADGGRRRFSPPDGVIPSILVVFGLAAVCAAGFVIALWIGLVLLGLSFGVVAWLRELSERGQ